jgi:hypothetical protein
MFRRRDRRRGPAPAWLGAFDRTLGLVERAKATLVSAAPRGRPSPVPLAEALAGFELGLREAAAEMDGWRSTEHADAWIACREGIDEALGRAERLRLHGSPQTYEDLIEEIDALVEPLEPFERAADRLGGVV